MIAPILALAFLYLGAATLLRLFGRGLQLFAILALVYGVAKLITP
jgi:hypothetical protein